MLKYLVLSMLGVASVGQVSSSCCDRRAPECQARYGTCMTSTNGDFRACDPIFCLGEPYPIPTLCCDPQSADCQVTYQKCLTGTFGSFSLCSSVFCRTNTDSTPTPTRAPCCNPEFMRCETMTNICPESKCCNKLLNVCPPEAPVCPTSGSADVSSTPFPSRVAPISDGTPSASLTAFPTRMVEPSRSAFPSMPVLSDGSPSASLTAFPTRVVDPVPSPFPSRSAMVSQSSDPTKRPIIDSPSPTMPNMTPRPMPSVVDSFANVTCCDPELPMCKLMYATCRESGSFMCELIFCKPSPAPSRRPRPSPKFSPFPSPKIIRPLPSVIPKEFVSVAKFDNLNHTELTKIPKLKEIQVKLSCIFHTAVEKIKIRNITIIKENGIRQVIKWNATEFDSADVPEVDCLAPARILRGLQSVAASNVEVEYTVVDPPAEAFAMDVNSITAPTANAPTSSGTQNTVQSDSQPSPFVVGLVGAASALAVVGAVVAIMKYHDRQRRVSPLNTRQQRVRVSMNPLEMAARSTVGSSTRSAFNPQRSRV